MNEARQTHPIEASNSNPTSEEGGRGKGASSAGPATGRASGPHPGALSGFPSPPKHVDVRGPRPEDPTACRVGGCLDPVAIVLVFKGLVGEWKDATCERHAQELLMELAEKLGVGRREVAR